MLRLFLFRFWPVLVPLLIYWLWLKRVGRKATIEGKPALRFRDGPWYWAVLSSLLVALGCFVVLITGLPDVLQGSKGRYTPPHMEGDRLVPGRVEKP